MYKRNELNDKRIADMYKNGIEIKQIMNTMQCGNRTIYTILKEYNIPLRDKSKSPNAIARKEFNQTIVECQNCGAKMPIGAKFCMECGSKILTRKQIMLNNLAFIRAKSTLVGPED